VLCITCVVCVVCRVLGAECCVLFCVGLLGCHLGGFGVVDSLYGVAVVPGVFLVVVVAACLPVRSISTYVASNSSFVAAHDGIKSFIQLYKTITHTT
jgi:hypothetical protein